MKQQWLLLLAMVGMSLGASARYDPSAGYCGNCYVSSDFRNPITSYDGCTQSAFQTACDKIDSTSLLYCGSSSLLIGKEDCGDQYSTYLNYNDPEYNCYYCWKSSED